MIVRWLGTVEYCAAWRLQEELADLRARGLVGDTLLLLEHPPTLTLGRGANRRNLLASDEMLAQLGVAVHEVDRGGDVTFHGPGQLVGYPIVDLSEHKRDLHWFLREMEAALIDLLVGFGLEARRFPPYTGVWIEDRKVAAIGVKVRRWVSTHGFALNVASDLSYFDLIVPCGIRDFGMTTLAREVAATVRVEDVLADTARVFRAHFPGRAEGEKEAVAVAPLLSLEVRRTWGLTDDL